MSGRRVLLCLSHSIEEFDQVRLLSGLGYDVFSLGGYIRPAAPHDPKRPALPDAPDHAELRAVVDALGQPDNIGAAQQRIPGPILEWLGDDGVVIFHHRLERLFGQWDWIRANFRGRIVWRTVGQSVENNERLAQPFRDDGLEIVRYSPKERNIPGFAGEDRLIRFYKDEAEWSGWVGDDGRVVQFVQDFANRWQWCNRPWWEMATLGLPRVVYGPNSSALQYGGGELAPDAQREALRSASVYLYTGTQPASYTLGLIEAMMTGVPVVSIGPEHMRIFPYGHLLYEGHEIAPTFRSEHLSARALLRELLQDPDMRATMGAASRQIAVEGFGRGVAERAWSEFLG